MILWSLADSDSNFWRREKFENLANLDIKNLKDLQKPGTFFSDCTLYVDNYVP